MVVAVGVFCFCDFCWQQIWFQQILLSTFVALVRHGADAVYSSADCTDVQTQNGSVGGYKITQVGSGIECYSLCKRNLSMLQLAVQCACVDIPSSPYCTQHAIMEKPNQMGMWMHTLVN